MSITSSLAHVICDSSRYRPRRSCSWARSRSSVGRRRTWSPSAHISKLVQLGRTRRTRQFRRHSPLAARRPRRRRGTQSTSFAVEDDQRAASDGECLTRRAREGFSVRLLGGKAAGLFSRGTAMCTGRGDCGIAAHAVAASPRGVAKERVAEAQRDDPEGDEAESDHGARVGRESESDKRRDGDDVSEDNG
jgi:hypothetical protein